MALFQKNATAEQLERRSVRRWVVDCEAKLKMLGGDRVGRLSDLSEAGARLDTDDPPLEGVSGFLEWADQEHFCKVVWANEKACGLVFERKISLSIVEQTSEAIDEPTGPVANFGKIPIGQKRSRRSSLVSD